MSRAGHGAEHDVAALRRRPGRLLTGRRLCAVNLRPGLEEAETSGQEEEIPPEAAGKEGVEEGVRAGVDGIEEHQQELGIRDGDERKLQRRRHGKDGDGSHAAEVREDEHGHAAGDARVGLSWGARGVAHSQVDAEVTATHAEEGQDVEEQERDHVDLRQPRLHVHGQADAHLQGDKDRRGEPE